MVEVHPFKTFVPPKTSYFLLGSFTSTNAGTKDYDWFYSNKVNQFWPIIRKVYNLALTTKEDKQQLFTKLELAVGDMILSCERGNGSAMDNNLINCVYDSETIEQIFKSHSLKTVFFSSQFVAKLFNKQFSHLLTKYPEVTLVTLPSPSPRYATISKDEKIKRYKEVLPKLRTRTAADSL